MRQKNNKGMNEQLPPLRQPLTGKAAQISDGIILRRGMNLNHVQELETPCDDQHGEVDERLIEKQRRSRRETARQVLYKLYRHNYIRRVQLPTDRLGRKSWLYGAATWKAVKEVAAYHQRELTKQYGNHIPDELTWKIQPHTLAAKYGWRKTDKILTLGPSTLKHFVREIDVNVILTLACRQGGYELVSWDSDLQVRRRHQEVKITYTVPETEEQVTTAIIPDGWYVIRDLNAGVTAHFFVEIDLGSQTQQSNRSANPEKRKKSWSHKFMALVNFLNSHFADLYGEDERGMVVVITTSQLRMQRLQSLCEHSGGGQNFLFTYFDIFTPKNVLTQPIYQQARNRTWVRLFEAYESLQAGEQGA